MATLSVRRALPAAGLEIPAEVESGGSVLGVDCPVAVPEALALDRSAAAVQLALHQVVETKLLPTPVGPSTRMFS